MAFAGIFVLGFFVATQLALGLLGTRSRSVRPKERAVRLLRSASMVALAGLLIVAEHGDAASYFFYGFAALHLVFAIWDSGSAPRTRSGREDRLRSVEFFLTPLVLGTLLVSWRFIDGAGFFVGMVMPSTTGLRTLCTGYSIAQGAVWAFELLFTLKRPDTQPQAAPLLLLPEAQNASASQKVGQNAA